MDLSFDNIGHGTVELTAPELLVNRVTGESSIRFNELFSGLLKLNVSKLKPFHMKGAKRAILNTEPILKVLFFLTGLFDGILCID